MSAAMATTRIAANHQKMYVVYISYRRYIMPRISVAEARRTLPDILNRASYAHERTVITRHDEDVAAVISMDELRLLDVLIERFENDEDIADARAELLLAREDRVAWDDIKSEFGL
jgi:prevent-host-death family protein